MLTDPTRWLVLLAASVAMLCYAASARAQLDETWTVTVNGQRVQVNPDGTFFIPNIPAADLFGPDGPGTIPDFLSDDFVRVIGSSTVNGMTRWVFNDPFPPSARLQRKQSPVR